MWARIVKSIRLAENGIEVNFYSLLANGKAFGDFVVPAEQIDEFKNFHFTFGEPVHGGAV